MFGAGSRRSRRSAPHGYLSRPIRHELQGLVLDDGPVAGVVADVTRIRSLEVAVDAIAIGNPEHRLEQPAAEALALSGGLDAHRLEISMRVAGVKARPVRAGLHERSKRSRVGAQHGQHPAGAAQLPPRAPGKLSWRPSASTRSFRNYVLANFYANDITPRAHIYRLA
jgi:hypothetical protein